MDLLVQFLLLDLELGLICFMLELSNLKDVSI